MRKKNKIKIPNLAFETTSTCNLNCRYCYNFWKTPDTQNFEQFNNFRQARKTLKKMFSLADVERISFTGGEPFKSERFNELVLFTRMQNKNVSIITNGNSASEEEYEQINSLGVNFFELPIHSHTAEAHDFMTNKKGSWQNSVNSVRQLIEMKAQTVVVVVITRANFDFLDKTLDFIASLGIKRVMLNRFNIGGNGILQKDNLQITKEQVNTAFGLASRAGKKLGISMSSNVCTPLCVVNPADYPNIVFTTCSPEVTKRPLTLDINGNLRFCNHSPTVLGNIFKHKLSKMLTSEKAQLWKNTKPDYCADCQLYSKCMAGCRAASEQLKLSLSSPDPILLT